MGCKNKTCTTNMTVSFKNASVWMKDVYATHLPILLKHFVSCINDICCNTFTKPFKHR